MRNEKLFREIEGLIATKKEGEYWDFKFQHHDNKADLLLDIMCMANNLVDRDAYIIYGVADSGTVVGVLNDQKRLNQQQIIDFLTSKKFAGGIRPVVEVDTLNINNKEVDVFIIKNSTSTPYFLIDEYKDRGRIVLSNAIYTRVGDTNTSINKSADIDHIEYLWKKRFLLTRSPLKQVENKLHNKSDWQQIDNRYYNKYEPAYTIELEDDDLGYGNNMFYSYLMMNPKTSFGMLKISHHKTELFKQQIVYLDSGRYLTVVPEWRFLQMDRNSSVSYGYKYFIKNSLQYNLHLFLFDEENDEAYYARRRFYKAVLVFESEIEKNGFETYVIFNKERFLADVSDNVENDESLEEAKLHDNEKIAIGLVLVKMLEEYRIGL